LGGKIELDRGEADSIIVVGIEISNKRKPTMASDIVNNCLNGDE